jgi:hypothetical protein
VEQQIVGLLQSHESAKVCQFGKLHRLSVDSLIDLSVGSLLLKVAPSSTTGSEFCALSISTRPNVLKTTIER